MKEISLTLDFCETPPGILERSQDQTMNKTRQDGKQMKARNSIRGNGCYLIEERPCRQENGTPVYGNHGNLAATTMASGILS